MTEMPHRDFRRRSVENRSEIVFGFDCRRDHGGGTGGVFRLQDRVRGAERSLRRCDLLRPWSLRDQHGGRRAVPVRRGVRLVRVRVPVVGQGSPVRLGELLRARQMRLQGQPAHLPVRPWLPQPPGRGDRMPARRASLRRGSRRHAVRDRARRVLLGERRLRRTTVPAGFDPLRRRRPMHH